MYHYEKCVKFDDDDNIVNDIFQITCDHKKIARKTLESLFVWFAGRPTDS